MKLSQVVMAGVAGILMATSAHAALNFGTASGYSVFATGNATVNGGSTQYGVAAGGNLTLTSASTGTASTISAVSGGNLTMNGGNASGSLYAGGNATAGSVSISGSLYAGKNADASGSVNGGVYYANNYTGVSYLQHTQSSYSAPINFTSAASEFSSYSSALSSLTSNGTVTSQWGGITLTGTSTTTNVFTIDASLFSGAWGLTLDAPTSSNIVINITGSAASLSLSMNTSGISASNIVLNFYEAETVNISNSTIYGTVLATNADTTLTGGHLYGNVITDNYSSSSISIDSYGYNSGAGTSPIDLANASAMVPEPATISILGLMSVAMLHRSRRK